MARPTVLGPSDEQVRVAGLAAIALLDDLMLHLDPTGKAHGKNHEARVAHVCQTYGIYLKPEYERIRSMLGEPVRVDL